VMDLSFHWPHPRYTTPIGEVSFRIHSFENVYGIDPTNASVEMTPDGTTRIYSDGLTWAGGQEASVGSMTIEISPTASGVEVRIHGEQADGIRSIGMTIHDTPVGQITGVREGSLDIPAGGRILGYPNGWFDLASPFFAVEREGDELLIVRSLDNRPRPKTFAFIPHFQDETVMDIDLLVEAEATRPSAVFDAPTWIVERSASVIAARSEHRALLDAVYEVEPWEERSDVPDWMREKSLVLTLHGRHFTGRTFLDYARMLDQIRRIAKQIDGERILAYLPGWEGRYYRWYGRYDTDPSLGGDDGFYRLIEEARQLGAHVMPMFGANVASRDVPGFERWGEPGLLRRPSGLINAGSVDWDGSRHYDHGSGGLINPAYKPWRAHLVEQIASLHDRFGFDATFLDISAMHSNDPNGDTTEGLRCLIDELHAAMPGHLIAGEGWFDAVRGIVPLVQVGHHDTILVYHDLPDEELFTRTNRSFGHVCLGDPAHGSSGVHEAGYVAAWRLPVRQGIIPTIGIVEDTLEVAPDRVAQIVGDAHEYADRFIRAPAALLV